MTDETIGNVPILILGNKIDKPEAISEEKLRELFGLYGQTSGKVTQAYFCTCFIIQVFNVYCVMRTDEILGYTHD